MVAIGDRNHVVQYRDTGLTKEDRKMQDWEIQQEEERLARLRAMFPVNKMADIEISQIMVILRGDQEIQWFRNEKAAGAWMQHVYGCVPWAGRDAGVTHRKYNYESKILDADTKWIPTTELLTIKAFGKRGPKAGDLCIHLGDTGHYHKGVGILDHSYGRDQLSVCFDASAYRNGDSISCSGGPIPQVEAADLIFDGLREVNYWRWWDGSAGGGQGGHYALMVPSWRWDKEVDFC